MDDVDATKTSDYTCESRVDSARQRQVYRARRQRKCPSDARHVPGLGTEG
jgi:hypothetical protein